MISIRNLKNVKQSQFYSIILQWLQKFHISMNDKERRHEFELKNRGFQVGIGAQNFLLFPPVDNLKKFPAIRYVMCVRAVWGACTPVDQNPSYRIAGIFVFPAVKIFKNLPAGSRIFLAALHLPF